jgi:hypothetical protein
MDGEEWSWIKMREVKRVFKVAFIHPDKLLGEGKSFG